MPASHRVRGWAASAATLTSLALHAGCSPAKAGFELRFDGVSESIGDGVTSLQPEAEDSSLLIDIAALHGATLRRTEGFDEGFALRFPSYDPSPQGPRAVVVVSNASADDVLDPGAGDFEFGATLRLDRESEGSTADDGNNVMQRGLFEHPAQYKLDVDARRPGCRIKGADGEIDVRADEVVNSHDWYRLTCRRHGDTVTLVVARLGLGGLAEEQAFSSRGPLGVVSAEDSGVPLSIGGKVASDGQVLPASDQFNGELDNVFLRFGSG